MPLYECERCHAIDNTALTEFWTRQVDNLAQLCSECETGTWHGEFPKIDARNAIGQGMRIEYRARSKEELLKIDEEESTDAETA